MLDIFSLFRRRRRRRAPVRSRNALDRTLDPSRAFDIFALFRRRPAPAGWINAPVRVRRTSGYFDIFALFGRRRPAVQTRGERGDARRREGYGEAAPIYPARAGTPRQFASGRPPRWDEPDGPVGHREDSDPSRGSESRRRPVWEAPELDEPIPYAQRFEISPDPDPARRARWEEREIDEPADYAERIETPPDREQARRARWEEPEFDAPGDQGERIETSSVYRRERRSDWDEPQAEEPVDQRFLAVHGVEKSFVGRKVVKGVSLYLRRGEAVGLLGPNGAGKTTVFYMITGLIKADRGRIELDGHDITTLPMYQRGRLGIGYLPQEASIFRGLTVEGNIRAVLEVVEPDRKRRDAELDALLEEFNIARLRKTPSIALSGGERRRVEIARALATRPAYMLLDEPFAGIDPIAVGDIQALVRHLTQRGIGVLITDHNVRETLGLTDRAYIIYSGEVLTEGNTADIVNNPDVRRLYLGEEFRL